MNSVKSKDSEKTSQEELVTEKDLIKFVKYYKYYFFNKTKTGKLLEGNTTFFKSFPDVRLRKIL